jgi:hypothetical protein
MYSANVQFKDKKAYNKFKRNLKNGKGTNIKPSDIHGEGIFDSVKAIGNSKITKSIAKAAAPLVAQQIKKSTGIDLAGNIAQAGVNAYAGSGFLDVMKSVAKSKITKGIVRGLTPAISQTIAKTSGSNFAGDVAGSALNAYSGSGVPKVVGQSGVALPATVLPSGPNQDLDLKATMKTRMAAVRSHRKKKGGSVVPLGGR